MTKEKHYCDDPRKQWIISCNGSTSGAALVGTTNAKRDRLPELNFEICDKEFIVQFDNGSDLIAARDTGKPVNINVVSLKRNKRIPGTIIHQKIIL